MLIHADVKSLELVTAGFLSRDPVLIDEINSGTDIHNNNRVKFGFTGDPKEARRIAKIFVFRLIYGGQAYSYAHDSDFNFISKSVDYWQGVVDQFYDKYRTVAKWHDGLVKTVLSDGQLVMPTGRRYSWDRADVARRLWFHRPKILNYPVQGLGADLVAIGRVALWKRLRKAGIPALFTSTVHDSIDIDVETCYNISVCEILRQSFEDVPKNFEALFGVKFDLPIKVEISYGPNLGEQEEYVPNHSTAQ